MTSVRSVEPNTDIVGENECTQTLFILTDGWAFRYMSTRKGGRQLSALLMPGDVANLKSVMFDRLGYGVRTITRATLLALSRDDAIALSDRHPGIARAFIWLGLVENAILGTWALSLGRRSAVERLAHLLCELSVRHEAEQDDASSFALPLTQEQIADALGLTAVHVNRTMQHLRAAGLIETANRIVTIPSVTKLRRIGGFDPHYLHGVAPAGGHAIVSGRVDDE